MPDLLITARAWAESSATLAQKETLLSELQEEITAERTKLAEMAKTLRGSLDGTTPVRLFNLGDGQVVMINSNQGVQLVTLEGSDAKLAQ